MGVTTTATPTARLTTIVGKDIRSTPLLAATQPVPPSDSSEWRHIDDVRSKF